MWKNKVKPDHYEVINGCFSTLWTVPFGSGFSTQNERLDLFLPKLGETSGPKLPNLLFTIPWDGFM